jgi:hypothetical protein
MVQAESSLIGIAAAIGKVGGFIGTYTFPQITASLANRSDYLGVTVRVTRAAWGPMDVFG